MLTFMSPPKLPKAEDFLTIDQVLERLPVSRRTLIKILDSGQLPSVRIGQRRFITQADLAEYVRARAS